MRRRLFNIASAVSLLLCVVTVVLWVRSYGKGDAILFFSNHWIDPLRFDHATASLYSVNGALLLLSGSYHELITVRPPTPQRGRAGTRSGANGPPSNTMSTFPQEDRLASPEGRAFYWRRTGQMPEIDSRESRFAPVNSHGYYFDAKWGPYSVQILPTVTLSGKRKHLNLKISAWSMSLLTSILPAIRLMRLHRARNRRVSGRCTACGYNLTGNTSGVCPECGTKIQLA